MVAGTRKTGERQRSTRQQQRPMLAWLGLSTAWIFILVSVSSGGLEKGVHAFSSTTNPAATTTVAHSSRRTTALQTKHDKSDEERTIPQETNKDPWTNLLVAAAFVTATLGDGMLANALVEDPSSSSTMDAATTAAKTATTPPATAATKLELVSPGSPIIETKIVHGDPKVLVQSTEKAVKNLAKTALLERDNRAALSESVQRLRTTVQTELSSVQAWQQVIGVFREYGIDLQQEADVVIRPPADWRRTYDDFVTKQQVNLLLNGEILQITMHYEKGSNTGSSLDEGGVVQPDDEWTLSVRGYKGFDPNALNLAALDPIPRQDYTPQWIKQWNNYWKSSLEDTDIFAKLFGSDKTHGDAIVVEGAAAIALSYAVSYAYYVNENEKAEEEARQKKAKLAEVAKKKKEAATAAKVEDKDKAGPPAKKKKEAAKPKKPAAPAKQTSAVEAPPPKVVETPKELGAKPTATDTTAVEKTKNDALSKDEEDDNLKVVIDFDKDGKVVLKAIESLPSGQRQNGLLPLLQALYFPWLGFFFPSTAEGAKGGRAPIVAFAQALYFPWGAVFFPKSPQDIDDSLPATDTEDKDEDDENNNGVLPFIRALWFPWIGLFQGK